MSTIHSAKSGLDGGNKKRRRRNTKKRTEDFSSDSDSSDSSSDSDNEIPHTRESEVVMKDDVSEAEFEDIDDDVAATVEVIKDPESLIPAELKSFDNVNKEKFESYYLGLMTTKFGDDLVKLRESKDFQPKSLPLLINALKEGVNIFDDAQQKLILSQLEDESSL
ncbi:hypothetical protein NADFUDRAFT_49560 [Nadsonia fulvescens var. elongata DSM 6958]|uniref:Ribosome assembly protein 3 n=1 Tax=Nadsonia fulvescens var. elongata DSM 6958 TaxID=857566 RepID=A0A1E3PP83_9ASCO|nr:hypothetical protein NADFUDRAFT_49560 [Nadsonia fulvescens var. elongata DSM 6958]